MRSLIPPVFLFQDALVFGGLLCFHTNLKNFVLVL